MNKKNLIVFVSSRNNYSMLENEVLKNIKLEGFELVNIDDCSIEEELEKGNKICKENNIVFLKNKSRGVQIGEMFYQNWIQRWGWDSLNANATIKIDKYKGTLIEEFFMHDITKGPLKNFEI